MHRPPRSLLLLTLAALFVPGCGGSSDASELNVVLFTLDTTRADFFGCYGYPEDTTPVVDALARDGALFELCISVAAVTPVSHASILTGLYQYQHGLRVMYAPSGFRLPDAVHTLPEILRDRGYRTGAFLSSYPVSEDFGFDAGFDVFDWPRPASGQARAVSEDQQSMRWDSQYQRRSDVTTDRTLEWLSAGDGPFFTWVHYWDPHGGSAAPPEDILARFAPGLDPENMDPAMRRGYYAAQVHMVDRQIGRVVEHLKATGEYGRTVIVVVSDHGEGLGDHGWQSHRILYQEQIHLPLVVYAPGFPEDVRVPDLVRSIDLFPTVLELLNVPAPGRVEGMSLVPLMRGEPDEAPRIAYAEQLNRLDANARMVERRPDDAFLHVVMDDTWKLIYRPEKPELSELYKIADDPREAENLIGRRPKVQQRLFDDLMARDAIRMEPFPPSDDGSQPNMDALHGLGYLGDDGE